MSMCTGYLQRETERIRWAQTGTQLHDRQHHGRGNPCPRACNLTRITYTRSHTRTFCSIDNDRWHVCPDGLCIWPCQVLTKGCLHIRVQAWCRLGAMSESERAGFRFHSPLDCWQLCVTLLHENVASNEKDNSCAHRSPWTWLWPSRHRIMSSHVGQFV
jgi:hypothetical protein